MAGSKKIPITVRSSYGLYSDNEKAAVKKLYEKTKDHSKDELPPIPEKTKSEKNKRLAALRILVDKIVDQDKEVNPEGKDLDRFLLAREDGYFADYEADELDDESSADEEQSEVNDVRKLMKKISKESQRLLKSSPTRRIQIAKREAALRELLEKEEEESKAATIHKLREEREQLLLDTQLLATQRHRLPTMLSYYIAELGKTNPASFRFLTEEQKLRLENKLHQTYLAIYSQYQLDKSEGKSHLLAGHRDLLNLCSQRIEELWLQPNRGEKIDFQDDLNQEINLFTKALKYLGLTFLAAWIVEKVLQLIKKPTVIKDWMTEINGKRLYWVWGGGMLASIIAFLPATFYSAAQASDRLGAPSPVTGYMSWVLYFCRLGINSILLFKHTINGPWMSEEESKIPAWERFTTQLEQRIFAILNDLLWAPINMACFFWLKGAGTLGYVGNIATVILLTMDLVLSLIRHWHETTKHNKEMLEIDNEKAALRQKIEEHEALRDRARDLEEKAVYDAKIAELEEQLKDLQKMQAKAKFDWKYKELALVSDCCYALGLLLAFCVVICFFFPPASLAPMTVLIIGLIGAAACFLATTIYTAYNCHLERAKTKEQQQMAKDECAELLEKFKSTDDPNLRKQLYLEMRGLMAESDYQHRLARYQLVKSFVSVFIDVAFPAAVFSTIVFAPVGLSIWAIIGIVAAVAAVSWYFNNMVLKNVEPKPHELSEFNDEEYQAFEEAALENSGVSLDDVSEFLQPPEQGKATTSSSRFFDSAEPSASYFRLGPRRESSSDGELPDEGSSDEDDPLLGLSGSSSF
ncbi:ATPase involved in DNA repair [Legionella massiliensis]|uniref:ATPase involved in DNA repair n=1 Tax=Legionella massiliensis TaxID=1034943 RepID=A0A078KPJ5_9GAMM|nr:hypothetical protein [Legionella massiliensis]CDZ76330.1 ATPase involved in DNA repair [Legionella massiliensis]CEE12068.1 hypothetical protein BN1094_00597 [Legionella massiliensis]